MKSNLFSALKVKRYLILSFVVMVLNIAAAVLLIDNSFGQTTSERKLDQAPLVAEVLVQNDSPLSISIVSIDNSNQDYQIVNYLVENSGKSPLRAYVILGSRKASDVGIAITRRFATKLFQPSATESGWLSIDRKDINPENKVYVSADYVEFDDGHGWGSDIAGQSEYIAGSRVGWKDAIKQADDLAKDRKLDKLIDLLNRPGEIVPPLNQSDKWQKGYSSAYKTVISTLREQYEGGGIDALTGKLNDLTKTK